MRGAAFVSSSVVDLEGERILDQSPAEEERDMPAYDYDVLVVGAGQGGLPAAHMAANLGAKVALIEEHEVGGT